MSVSRALSGSPLTRTDAIPEPPRYDPQEIYGVPAWSGAMIGHSMPQWTLAEGIEVDADAAAGTIRMVEPAVA